MQGQLPDTSKLTLGASEYKGSLNEVSELQREFLLDNSNKNLSLNYAAQVFLQILY